MALDRVFRSGLLSLLFDGRIGLMAKVTAPLLSLTASGTIAKAITYVCGHFARKAVEKTEEQPAQLFPQGEKFTEAAGIWGFLNGSQQDSWRNFTKVFKSAPECQNLGFYLTGYNLFMSYYLRFGVDGWENYPSAPV